VGTSNGGVVAKRSGDPSEMPGAHNTSLGELYRVRGGAPDWQAVQTVGDGAGYVPGQMTTLRDRE